jgi:hypothetical protein
MSEISFEGGPTFWRSCPRASFRIAEAFAADPAFDVDSTELVERLDEGGISLVWGGSAAWRRRSHCSASSQPFHPL